MSRRELYPEIEPFAEGRLRVSDLHEIHYEQVGSVQGQPAIFVHGGPGGGIEPIYRRYFDPERYHVVLFDQRGCGQSTPHACLDENTTWDLVADMERLREQLGIDRWVVFGGSWGSTLSLAYAQTHPERVKALVLRGIFLLRPEEIRWFYQEGTSALYPDAWEKYLAPIAEDERDDLVAAYYRRLTSEDASVRAAAAKAWSTWEGSTSKLIADQALIDRSGEGQFADAFARIECHYFTNGGFFDHPDQLLDNVDRIRDIPGVIVQGRYDVVCPMMTAWALHRRWPEADFHVIADAGHSCTEPGIVDQLIRATDRYADLP